MSAPQEASLLPYMVVTAIYLMCLRYTEQISFPPTQGCHTCNLPLKRQAALDMLENSGSIHVFIIYKVVKYRNILMKYIVYFIFSLLVKI